MSSEENTHLGRIDRSSALVEAIILSDAYPPAIDDDNDGKLTCRQQSIIKSTIPEKIHCKTYSKKEPAKHYK